MWLAVQLMKRMVLFTDSKPHQNNMQIEFMKIILAWTYTFMNFFVKLCGMQYIKETL